jgi:hypothetical protein
MQRLPWSEEATLATWRNFVEKERGEEDAQVAFTCSSCPAIQVIETDAPDILEQKWPVPCYALLEYKNDKLVSQTTKLLQSNR